MVENNLLDLLTPAQAAEELEVNVTTLRKYSLLVEKVTGDDAFFARKNNKRRNYTHQNISDFRQMLEISQKEDMTLELAVEDVFGGKLPDKDIAEVVTEGMSDSEKKLNDKIAKQAKEIMHLRRQLKDSQQENYALIRALKKTQETPLFDYDMNVNEAAIAPKPSPQVKTQPQAVSSGAVSIENTDKKEADDKYAEAMRRARAIREQKMQANAELVDDTELSQEKQNLRTLSSMQISESKKKWWQR